MAQKCFVLLPTCTNSVFRAIEGSTTNTLPLTYTKARRARYTKPTKSTSKARPRGV
ncbi:hypothetical protein HBZC1_p0240 (plasmid) [Helicobacter bizzozeronii CIII-1]|uniref:Uncharacterized protein n=1 Tax=Helicobacter bizzozeronii (strain CIII-1) TaxID=1002804 RepID=F8KUG9_HELBC|nr:hypothetical protein HBZC1_p0240 [Helicobacter bizzozeronii CIII-1]